MRGELQAHIRNRQVLEAERSRLSAKHEELQTSMGATGPEADEIRKKLSQIEAREADLVARLELAETTRLEVTERHEKAATALRVQPRVTGYMESPSRGSHPRTRRNSRSLRRRAIERHRWRARTAA